MSTEVWELVLTAAVGHALWNFAARKAAGEAAVIWLSVVVGTLVAVLLCAYTWWQGQGAPPTLSWPGGLCLVATGIIHGLYFALLAEAYEHGEISLVYPVARGSGVGLTALAAWLVLGEDISLLGASGIALVLAGIFCLGAPALKHQTRGLQLALGVGLTIACYSLVDKIGVGYVQPLHYNHRHVADQHPRVLALGRAPVRGRVADDGPRPLADYRLDRRRLAGHLFPDSLRLHPRPSWLHRRCARVLGSTRGTPWLVLSARTAHSAQGDRYPRHRRRFGAY